MASDKIIYYDRAFLAKFEKLKEITPCGDAAYLHRFLIENFGFVFDTFQYYAKQIASGEAQDFEQADEATKRELMRPLSYRQYRMTQRAFCKWEEGQEDAIYALSDFLEDNGRIYEKTVMSAAEVGACSLILEQLYCILAAEEPQGNPHPNA